MTLVDDIRDSSTIECECTSNASLFVFDEQAEICRPTYRSSTQGRMLVTGCECTTVDESIDAGHYKFMTVITSYEIYPTKKYSRITLSFDYIVKAAR